MKERRMAEENLIFKAYTGSILYGCNTEDSDEDYVGIFIPDKRYTYGLSRCDQVQLGVRWVTPDGGVRVVAGKNLTKVKVDCTIYNLIKFFYLAMNCNPNIISLLFTPKEHRLWESTFSQIIMDNKALFLSKKCYHTFRGYAHAQRNRLTTKTGKSGSKRVKLIEKYGYDTKKASHMIRLLSECFELLTCHSISYPSRIADELLKIKQGQYTIDYVLARADAIERSLDDVYKVSTLPRGPDRAGIEKLQMSLLERYWDDRTFKELIDREKLP